MNSSHISVLAYGFAVILGFASVPSVASVVEAAPKKTLLDRYRAMPVRPWAKVRGRGGIIGVEFRWGGPKRKSSRKARQRPIHKRTRRHRSKSLRYRKYRRHRNKRKSRRSRQYRHRSFLQKFEMHSTSRICGWKRRFKKIGRGFKKAGRGIKKGVKKARKILKLVQSACNASPFSNKACRTSGKRIWHKIQSKRYRRSSQYIRATRILRHYRCRVGFYSCVRRGMRRCCRYGSHHR